MKAISPDDIIERYFRTDSIVLSAVTKMHDVTGISIKKIERTAARLAVSKMSASQLRRTCEA